MTIAITHGGKNIAMLVFLPWANHVLPLSGYFNGRSGHGFGTRPHPMNNSRRQKLNNSTLTLTSTTPSPKLPST